MSLNLCVAIVDDTEHDRTRLCADAQALLEQKGCTCRTHAFTSAEEFLQDPSRDATNIAFLDVRMGGMDGIELAMRLRDVDKSLVIVFVTSSREYALDAFPTHPFDYLVKPYTRERLSTVLEDVLVALRMRDEQRSIHVDVPYGSIDVPLNRVVVVEARRHCAVLTLEDGQEVRSTSTFAEVNDLVADAPQFLLVNRGVVLNMDHVEHVEDATVVMEGGLRLPLRKRDRNELARAITQHMISRTGRR